MLSRFPSGDEGQFEVGHVSYKGWLLLAHANMEDDGWHNDFLDLRWT